MNSVITMGVISQLKIQSSMWLSDILAVLCQGNEGIKTRQMKEAVFELKVKQNIKEEEANNLKW